MNNSDRFSSISPKPSDEYWKRKGLVSGRTPDFAEFKCFLIGEKRAFDDSPNQSAYQAFQVLEMFAAADACGLEFLQDAECMEIFRWAIEIVGYGWTEYKKERISGGDPSSFERVMGLQSPGKGHPPVVVSEARKLRDRQLIMSVEAVQQVDGCPEAEAVRIVSPLVPTITTEGIRKAIGKRGVPGTDRDFAERKIAAELTSMSDQSPGNSRVEAHRRVPKRRDRRAE